MEFRNTVNAMDKDRFNRLLADKREELFKMMNGSSDFRALSDEVL